MAAGRPTRPSFHGAIDGTAVGVAGTRFVVFAFFAAVLCCAYLNMLSGLRWACFRICNLVTGAGSLLVFARLGAGAPCAPLTFARYRASDVSANLGFRWGWAGLAAVFHVCLDGTNPVLGVGSEAVD